MEKQCSRCNGVKPIADFSAHRTTTDGYHTVCKSCVSTYNKEYRKKNRERLLVKDREYAADHADVARERSRLWNKNNPERRKRQLVDNYERHKVAGTLDKYYGNVDREAAKRRASQWKRDNPGRVAAQLAKRRAAKKNATPLWADLKQIELLYIEAARITEATGVKHQVDHIVPLCNDIVCGLHVSSNLRIVTAEENNSKKCKLDESLL